MSGSVMHAVFQTNLMLLLILGLSQIMATGPRVHPLGGARGPY